MRRYRVLDWRTRLVRWAEAREGLAFQWGVTDCATLAREALIQLFGADLVADVPTYHSAREALRVRSRHGGVGAALERIGARKTTLPFMRAGDIIVADEPEEDIGHEAVFVCVDAAWCVTSSRAGVLTALPVEPCTVYTLWEIVADG